MGNVTVKARRTYGTERLHVVEDRDGKALLNLTGRKTIGPIDVRDLNALGIAVLCADCRGQITDAITQPTCNGESTWRHAS